MEKNCLYRIKKEWHNSFELSEINFILIEQFCEKFYRVCEGKFSFNSRGLNPQSLDGIRF